MASTPWPEKPSSNKIRVIRELVEGQECASKLRILLQKPSEEHGSSSTPSAQELLVKILRSFNETLAVLSYCETAENISQNQASFYDDSPCSDDRRSEESTESRKRPASKDRRGCYKRKREANTLTVVSATLEDGHGWRKYGQKEILNSKFPRSYFRCTRKYDQGCRATKQVQRVESDPQMYQITYIGDHTCREIRRAPPIVRDSDSWESFIVSSCDSKISSDEQPQPQQLNSTIKQEESKDQETASDLTNFDSIAWKDLMSLDSSVPGIMSPKMDSDYTCTSRSLEMAVDFDNTDFHFDEFFLGN